MTQSGSSPASAPPPDPAALFAAALAAHRGGAADRARRLYQSVIMLRPAHPAALANLALLLRQSEGPGRARQLCRRVVGLTPADAAAWFNYGNACHGLGEHEPAIRAFRCALGLDPALTAAHVNLGTAAFFGGFLELAVVAFRRALAMKPGDALVLNKLSSALQDYGRFDAALDAYRTAVANGLPVAPGPEPGLCARLDRLAADHRRRFTANRRRLARVAAAPEHESGEAPYLSVTTCTRNDGHGGDGLRRAELSLGWTIRRLEAHAIPSEVIVVDWNPPAGMAPVREVLALPSDRRHVTIRHVEVPPAVHAALVEGTVRADSGMMAAIGLNVGLRRGRGRFLLPAATDIIYPDALVRRLARRDLEPGCFYRSERADVARAALEIAPDALPDWCRGNVLRRWPRHLVRGAWPDGLPMLFSNACGDFTLMAREHFHRLGGYREDDPTHMHCDALLIYAAYGAGLAETVFPEQIYHIDHDGGWEARLTSNPEIYDTGVPFNDAHAYYNGLMADLGTGRRPYDFNDSGWGLGDIDLPEWRSPPLA